MSGVPISINFCVAFGRPPAHLVPWEFLCRPLLRRFKEPAFSCAFFRFLCSLLVKNMWHADLGGGETRVDVDKVLSGAYSRGMTDNTGRLTVLPCCWTPDRPLTETTAERLSSVRMTTAQLYDAEGEPLTKILVGETAAQAKERLSSKGILENADGLALADGDSITAKGAPYVFKLGPLRQQQGLGEKKRRLEDLLFYHRATIERDTSKSSKLAKIKKLGDGSKRCFLCGNAGTETDRIEATHVLQKQDINATGGEEALLTLDTLKNWSAGLGWKRPFEMHNPMNLIWLCRSHNLAFDRHEFGLSLGGLDGRVVFFSYLSYLDEYGPLVTDANARLADAAQPFYDMSYVSRRAIVMRLCKAQSAGYFVDNGNPQAREAVVALCAAASLKHENDSEDEDERATASAD